MCKFLDPFLINKNIIILGVIINNLLLNSNLQKKNNKTIKKFFKFHFNRLQQIWRIFFLH